MKKFWSFLKNVVRDNESNLSLFIAVLSVAFGGLVSFLFYKDYFITSIVCGGVGCGIIGFLMYFLPRSTDEVAWRETTYSGDFW